MNYELLLEEVRNIVRQEMKGVQPKFLTVTEAAELTRFSKGTIYNMVNSRKIPFIKPNGKLLFVADQLIEWLTTKSIAPQSEDRQLMGSKWIRIR